LIQVQEKMRSTIKVDECTGPKEYFSFIQQVMKGICAN
jgi:hypothetical protein